MEDKTESKNSSTWPKFSIVIPIFNAEKYLSECIESVLDQDFCDWELVLVNDGSTDNSEEICNRYVESEKKIKLISIVNSGVSIARNVGIDNASGQYIMFLDADDFIEKNTLFIADKKLDGNQDFVLFNYSILNNKSKFNDRNITEVGTYVVKDKVDELLDFAFRQRYWKKDRWYGNFRTVWGKCFDSSVLKKNSIRFVENLKFGEDTVFVLSYLIKCKVVRICPEYLYVYRQNQQSAMHSRVWKGTYQGSLFLNIAEDRFGKFVSYGALRDLWMELAEYDWMSIMATKDMTISEKYQVFNKLIKSNSYRRFATAETTPYSDIRQKLYCSTIKYKMVFVLFCICWLRRKIDDRIYERDLY